MTPSWHKRAAYQDGRGNNYISGQDQETAVIHTTTMVSLNPSHEGSSEAILAMSDTV